MIPESTNLEDYLISDAVMQADHPIIIEKARSITHHAGNDTDKARALYEWVRDEIPHSGDIRASVVTCSALEVLEQGTGICYSKCHLLVALLRAVGIPAGFCYQVLMFDPPHDKTLVLHGLTGIYLAGHNSWTVVDARGNTGGLNAQFAIHTPQLAFAMDPSAGECLLDTVYVSPLPAVVENLKKAGVRDEFENIRPEDI